MGKYLIPFFFLCAFRSSSASQADSLFRPIRPLATAGPMFLSGACWGVHEKISHHWDAFHERFPNARVSWWNPQVSWKRKYVDGDKQKGRNHRMIWFTDAKHLMATGTQVFGFAAGCSVFWGQKRPWWHYAAQVAGSFLGYYVGNWMTFDAFY